MSLHDIWTFMIGQLNQEKTFDKLHKIHQPRGGGKTKNNREGQ